MTKLQEEHIEQLSKAIDTLLVLRQELTEGAIPHAAVLDHCAERVARVSCLCFDLKHNKVNA